MEDRLPQVLIPLMKGVVYQESDPARWQSLLDLQARVREYCALLGLELILDEVEGYAYLRQRPAAEGEAELPRLVPRRQLSYPVSLLLALLRKRLAEFDAMGGASRLILSRGEITDLVRVFLPETTDEARFLDRMDQHLRKLVDLGFLRPLKGQDDRYEVCRILKSFVDAQWLQEFDARLQAYRDHLEGGTS